MPLLHSVGNRSETMISHGHYLFCVLQDGKYFAATRDGVAYDYWDELPEARREQYQRAALLLMQQGADLEKQNR